MKICYLANATSIHTQRWAKSLSSRGRDIEIISFDKAEIEGIKVHYIEPVKRERNRLPYEPKNITYIAKALKVRELIKKIKPDIVHAHYATGYGLTGALCNIHPLIISTWGTDIFDAPRKNKIFENIVRYNLKKADYIIATSKALADETMLYTDKKLEIIPFGIDIEKFNVERHKDDTVITFGIVKSLEEVYGIEYLIRAFEKIYKKYGNLRLLIVGGGNLYDKLKIMCAELKIEDYVTFTGKVLNTEVPIFLNEMDIFVMPSIRESFGVAALEAQACGVPVIASDVGGIPEVVIDGETGLLFKAADTDELAEKMEYLINNSQIRNEMGRRGRAFVENSYNWEANVDEMYKLYENIIEGCV
ncbi:GDP-mannose-dependent alpha-(1-6)-phosphatidylinositol monomannoside mannosyltransferase [Oxobacter pfennigii]|uniref:GDP-mannose-dependent alpha-(1-6)-phosphatidylinositol monomannoside mannosyltransferase n=1 Tax=Oxobacter pfennigii TaxID=36849 RepID=A0A0P8WCB3_9CLOT|nr:glycosyltransferase family 4 protein [Oxobacter pfennigii]KPU45366.1 GDP-mannose-dependent alpha-(1-6)-phosphatidylinositol monomannoside mannosyltransferase [Oxobacter pfennigii]